MFNCKEQMLDPMLQQFFHQLLHPSYRCSLHNLIAHLSATHCRSWGPASTPPTSKADIRVGATRNFL